MTLGDISKLAVPNLIDLVRPRANTSARTPGITPNASTPTTTQGTTNTTQGGSTSTGSDGWLQDLMKYSPLLAGIFADIYGAKTQNDSINRAMEADREATRLAIEGSNKAAENATQLQRDMFNKNIELQMPRIETGNTSLAALSNLMGLPQSPSNPQAANAPYQTPAAPSLAFRTQTRSNAPRFMAAKVG